MVNETKKKKGHPLWHNMDMAIVPSSNAVTEDGPPE
jgi:hypothetical protein